MEQDEKLLLQDFARRLNVEPNPNEFEDTPDKQAKTLPISFVEMTLDELFFGLWSTSEPKFQQVFNEVVATIELTVIHPVTGKEIKRTGWASVVITQDKGAQVSDFNMTKKKNALDLAFPKLGAEALKNAAKSLGKIFGRDINRKEKDVFKPILKPLPDEALKKAIERVKVGEVHLISIVESNSIMTEEQKAILRGAVPDQKRLG